MRVVDYVVALKATKSKARHKKLIRDAWINQENFFTAVQMSMDNTWHMPVDVVPEIQDEDDGTVGSFTFAEFVAVRALLAQAGTAEAAKELIYDAAERANITEWNQLYRRILLRRLHNDIPLSTLIQTLTELTH